MFGDREGHQTRQVVSIDSVNARSLSATGITQFGTRISVALGIMFGGVMNIPSLGDQWLVEKIFGQFILVAKLGFQDERRMLDLEPGDSVLGLRGKTHVFGREVVIDSSSGMSQEGVDVFDPPRISMSTSSGFSSNEGGLVFFEESSSNSDFNVEEDGFTPPHDGVYSLSVAFYRPGGITLTIGARSRSFVGTGSFTALEKISDDEKVSVAFLPDEDIPESPFATGSLSAFWVGQGSSTT